MFPKAVLLAAALTLTITAADPPPFMGRKVTVTAAQTDQDGFFPKGPASVCLEAPPQRQCYTAPDQFGRAPEVEQVQLGKGTPALLFSAAGGGVSGWQVHFALLRAGTAKDLQNILDVSISNQGRHAFWTITEVSSAPVFVTADYLTGPNETHYGEHRFIISAYVLYSGDFESYYLDDQYMTVRKYESEDAGVLASEKPEIFARLRRVHPVAGHYDLGGSCQDVRGPGQFSKIQQARKSGDWNRVIELEKTSVREMCGNAYRWFELAEALLDAQRPAEALAVLQEMDSRGFDVNPALIGSMHPEVAKYMQAPAFRASPLGVKIGQLMRASDERRARYREELKKLPPDQKPPDPYISKGACPFECCRYGSWTVLEDTELVAAPGSRSVVGKAGKGTRVVGLTGEVHLQPEPVVVLKDGDLPKDSIAFVLDNLGEGYARVYARGKIVEAFVGVADYCLRVSEGCWGEHLLPASERKEPVWWVKVRLPSGITGWTDKPDRFGDKDACG